MPSVLGDLGSDKQRGEDGDAAESSSGDADEAGGSDEEREGAGGEEIADGGPQSGDEERPGGASGSDETAGEGDVLARALEDLDGEIRDERIAATHRAGARPAGSDGEVDRAGGGQGDESGESGNADGQGTSQSGGGAMPGRRTVASAMPPTPRPPLPSAPDTPDARDDDVVARQLREAAMAETDPELREALWEELERYKSGLSRRR